MWPTLGLCLGAGALCVRPAASAVHSRRNPCRTSLPNTPFSKSAAKAAVSSCWASKQTALGAFEPVWGESWEAALALLDAYPWQALYPLAVHPQFQKLIYQAVSRYHGSHHEHCEEWDRVMQADHD